MILAFVKQPARNRRGGGAEGEVGVATKYDNI